MCVGLLIFLFFLSFPGYFSHCSFLFCSFRSSFFPSFRKESDDEFGGADDGFGDAGEGGGDEWDDGPLQDDGDTSWKVRSASCELFSMVVQYQSGLVRKVIHHMDAWVRSTPFCLL